MTTFLKMHGTGNDFVVLDGFRDPLPAEFDFAAAAIDLCDRHRGVGGDGLLLLAPAESPELGEARMRMWNPDGSEDMCGNGLRCVALLAWQRDYVVGREFAVQTLAGTRQCAVIEPGQVQVAMGQPSFALADIPMLRHPEYMDPSPRGGQAPREFALRCGDLLLPQVSSLSTGTTHTIVFTAEPVDDAAFAEVSPQLEYHPCYPERTSILWTTVRDEHHLAVRIWERGAGETLACGTGACAAAIAAINTGRCSSEIEVASKGGRLKIAWAPDGEILMTGPAAVVYTGTTWGDGEVER